VNRVASLLPSLTELVYALGAGEQLVGRSHECDHPPQVAALPVLTEAQLDPAGTSRAIDDRVRSLVRDGLSIYRVDPAALRAVAPDLILTQDHCEVCAASLADVERALAGSIGAAPRVVSVSPGSLAEVWQSFREVARALGRTAAGEALLAGLTDRVTEIGERAAALGSRPRVACIEWLDPLMSAGNWVPELVALAGGEAVLATAGAHSPWLDWADLETSDPDILVAIPCGFDLTRTRAELPALMQRPGFAELRAVQNGRCFAADGNAFFNRPGPRLLGSLEILAELIHPEHFDFGHAQRSWIRLT
jgi:iron complex transport system substrate-binding protein